MSFTHLQLLYLAQASVHLQAVVRWDTNVTGIQLAAYLLDALDANRTVVGKSVPSIITQATWNDTLNGEYADPRKLLADISRLPTNRAQNLAWPWILVTLVATLCLALRLFSRKKYTGGLQKDDWWMIAGWIPATATTFIFLVDVYHDEWPRHSWDQTYSQIQGHTLLTYCTTFTIIAAGACVRTGFIYFYSNFIRTKVTRIIMLIVLAATWIYFALSISYYTGIIQIWRFVNHPELFCGMGSPGHLLLSLIWLMTAMNIAIDFGILLLPLPTVFKLSLSHRDKISVTILIALGGVTSFTSVLRYFGWRESFYDNDLSWRLIHVSTWSMLEPLLGIICASVPAIRRMVQVVANRRTGTSQVEELDIHKKSSTSLHNLSPSDSHHENENAAEPEAC